MNPRQADLKVRRYVLLQADLKVRHYVRRRYALRSAEL
jgi:hypothetical protein